MPSAPQVFPISIRTVSSNAGDHYYSTPQLTFTLLELSDIKTSPVLGPAASAPSKPSPESGAGPPPNLLLKWLQRLQFKLSQVETQCSTATQFFTV